MQLIGSTATGTTESTEARPSSESDRWTDRTGEAYRARARRTARRSKEQAKAELARRAFDTLEGYFPEEARARRRRTGTTLFVVGIAVGIFLRHLAGRGLD